MRFVLASDNRHKLAEFRGILARHNVVAMPDGVTLPPEGAESFAANAGAKARALAAALAPARHAGDPRPHVIADDSGLEVEALGWAPGVISSRYCGRDGDDAGNIARLLGELEARPGGDPRRARFVCVLACITPAGAEHEARGEWPGTIARAPRGAGGFGYDPVFVPDGFDLTVAEWPQEAKDRSSHRARAGRALLELLTDRGGA